MARDRRYADKGGAAAAGMHLFNFSETLSGKRLPEERRIGLDYQTERLYKGRDSSSHRSKREDVETTRSSSRTPDKKLSFMHRGGDGDLVKSHSGRDMDFRPSNVVARLMGLDSLPKEPVAAKQSKENWGDQGTPKHLVDKQQRRQNEFKQAPPAATVVQETYCREDKGRLSRKPVSDDRKRGSPKELSEVLELEELKRQLALKQMLVRDKLNEAKRLLTGEKVSDKRWVVANKQLNQSKEFLDAIDFFQTNRDAFLKYVDDQDSVLGNNLERNPGKAQRNVSVERQVPEGLRNPIVRKVIEGRREDALKNFSRQPSLAGSGEHNMRNPVPDNQAPTRIVVLKPSPNRNASPTSASFSAGPYTNGRDEIIGLRSVNEVCDDMRKVTDASRNEGTTNPREIAKEIARQVRESVVRDLARNAAGSLNDQGGGKRLNVTLDNSDGPRLGGLEVSRGDGATTPRSRKSKSQAEFVDDTITKTSQASLQKKPVRVRQQLSGSSPPMARPVSKGIVVLVPDQSVGSRISKVSEAQNRESTVSKQAVRKDRARRNHQALTETSHKLGDTFRKAKGQPSETGKRNNVDVTSRDIASSVCVQEDTGAKVEDESLDGLADSASDLLGYGGSFLLKTSGFESQGENEASCEASDSRDTFDSEYAAENCVSDAVSRPANVTSGSISEFVSSDDTAVTVSTSQVDEEIDSKEQLPTESSQSSEVSSCRHPEQMEVLPEEEPVKNSPTTTDVAEAVEGDETSVSSDNSGQPSPVSVLESSFEESPSHVDFNTISSELEELRLQLHRLKWDGSDQERLGVGDASDVVVEKIVVEQQQTEPEITVEDTSSNSSQLNWPELEKCIAKETEEEQKIYVKNILLASGLVKSCDSGSYVVEQHSKAHSLDSMLFEQLEGFYRVQADDFSTTETAKVSSMRRRLLFDVVDEMLAHKRVNDPWLATVRAVPGGGYLLSEVWSKLSDFFVYPEGEDLQHTVENLIEKYLTKGDRWMDLQSFVETIGMELECELLDELYEECIDL